MTENRDEIWHWANHNNGDNNGFSVAEVHSSPTNNNKLYIYKRVQNRWYLCGHCSREVPEAQLIKHHSDRHSSVPFDKSMYYLVKTREMMQCLACGAGLQSPEIGDNVVKSFNENGGSKRSERKHMPCERKPNFQNMKIIKCDIWRRFVWAVNLLF